MALDIVGVSGDELLAEYAPRQSKDNIQQDTAVAPIVNNATIQKPRREGTYYSRNDFKRYMGYEEPDYLMVAGFYNSVEESKISKIYGKFLVKKADYVAERLGWFTKDGKPDAKRAMTAIRTACRKKAPNGLYYMYTESNKDHCLSDKGDSRIYMSGKRHQELLDEQTYLEAKFSNTAAQNSVSELVSAQISEYERIQYMIREVADRRKIAIYNDGSVKWIADQFLKKLSKEGFDMPRFEKYCDFITSEWYSDHAAHDQYCPRISQDFDIYHKYDNIIAYAKKHKQMS